MKLATIFISSTKRIFLKTTKNKKKLLSVPENSIEIKIRSH